MRFGSLRGVKRRGNLIKFLAKPRLLRCAHNDNVGILQRSLFIIHSRLFMQDSGMKLTGRQLNQFFKSIFPVRLLHGSDNRLKTSHVFRRVNRQF